MGKVSNLRVVESLGSTVRLGWTGVAGATQYRVIILNTEGQRAFSVISSILLYTCINIIFNILRVMSCQWIQRKSR